MKQGSLSVFLSLFLVLVVTEAGASPKVGPSANHRLVNRFKLNHDVSVEVYKAPATKALGQGATATDHVKTMTSTRLRRRFLLNDEHDQYSKPKPQPHTPNKEEEDECDDSPRKDQPHHGSAADLKTIDLTPAICAPAMCWPSSFQAPDVNDCNVIISSQLYNGTGSLTATPGTMVIATYKTCVTVFQNPTHSDLSLQFNWAQFGTISNMLEYGCLINRNDACGGSCVFQNYLTYKLTNVMISIQRLDDGN